MPSSISNSGTYSMPAPISQDCWPLSGIYRTVKGRVPMQYGRSCGQNQVLPLPESRRLHALNDRDAFFIPSDYPAAIATSFVTVLILRAVPDNPAGIWSLESAMPSP